MRLIRVFAVLFIVFIHTSAFAEDFQIIHFNDVYEIEPVQKGKVGGIARAATVIKQYDNEKTLMTFGGDALSGSSLSLYLQGREMVEAFNMFGLDVAVIGNHECDYGMDVLKERIAESKFKWLAANLLDKKTNNPLLDLKPWSVSTINGVKIGVIGLVGDWLTSTVGGSDAQYSDFVSMAQKSVNELKAQKVEFIVALTHMFLHDDEKLAQSVSGIDLILGGHDHEPVVKTVNGTLIIKAGADLENIAILDVDMQNGSSKISHKMIPIDDKIESDSQALAFVNNTKASANEHLKKVVGETKVDLNAVTKTVRTEESNVGNFITDVFRDHTGADIAFQNGGGIRSNSVYPKGKITIKDIYSIFPFKNNVVLVKMSGEKILSSLEHAVSDVENVKGRFLQVSGMKFSYDMTKPVGSRIIDVTVNGKKLEPKNTYKVATNHFVADGGDGFSLFKDAPRVINKEVGQLMMQVAIEYIKKKKIIAPKREGRITRIDKPIR